MVRVEDGLEEVGVARRTAHIFGRCAVSASEAQGAGRQDGIRRVALLHRHPVFPVIAEVVEVLERLHARECGLALDALLGTGRVAPVELRVGDAVALAGDLEFVQMPPVPAHDALDHVMEPAQRDRLGHDDPAPDRGLDPGQFDAQLQQVGRFAGARLEGMDGAHVRRL